MESTEGTYTYNSTGYPFPRQWPMTTASDEIHHYPILDQSQQLQEDISKRKKLSDFIREDKRKPNVMYCIDKEILDSSDILILIELMKNRLVSIADDSKYKSGKVVDHVECQMTPKVKDNMIKVWKKQNSYGKSSPFVPRFDKYGEELPTTLNVAGGMIIKLIEETDSLNAYYLELEAVLKVMTTEVVSHENKNGKEFEFIDDVSSMFEEKPSELWDITDEYRHELKKAVRRSIVAKSDTSSSDTIKLWDGSGKIGEVNLSSYHNKFIRL